MEANGNQTGNNSVLDNILQRNGVKNFENIRGDKWNNQVTNKPEEKITPPYAPSEVGNTPPPSPSVKYPNKPTGWSDEQYKWALGYGYTPESISRITAPYDPNENFISRIYESSISKPKPIDEKKVRNAKLLGSIGDSLGLLAQMWSAGKGAHISKRDYSQTASAQISARENDLRNRYEKEYTDYENNRYGARLKDFIIGQQRYDAEKNQLQSIMGAKNKYDQEQKKQDQAQKNFETKLMFDFGKHKDSMNIKGKELNLKEGDQKERQRHNKTMESQGWARVQDSRNRTTAYIRKMDSGGNGNYQMVFQANPQDTTSQKDAFNNNVKVFEMTKGQVDQYAREALSDTQFINRHPELILQKPDISGRGSMKYKPNTDIAAAYLKERYDNGFSSSKKDNNNTIKSQNWNNLFENNSWIDEYDNPQFQIQ